MLFERNLILSKYFRFEDDVDITVGKEKSSNPALWSNSVKPVDIETKSNSVHANDISSRTVPASVSSPQGGYDAKERTSRGSDWLGISSDGYMSPDANRQSSHVKSPDVYASGSKRHASIIDNHGIDKSEAPETNLKMNSVSSPGRNIFKLDDRASPKLSFLEGRRRSSSVFVDNVVTSPNQTLPVTEPMQCSSDLNNASPSTPPSAQECMANIKSLKDSHHGEHTQGFGRRDQKRANAQRITEDAKLNFEAQQTIGDLRMEVWHFFTFCFL